MTVETNLNVFPYLDDFDEEKDYYKILFKPTVSVQVRELNQLQTMLQKQVERFGDSIYEKGTIVDGCNFNFVDRYPYVKLLDTEENGNPTVPSRYVGLFATSQNGVRAHVVNSLDGFEANDPFLKTIYLRYTNSGADGETESFSPDQVLTIQNSDGAIDAIAVLNGGLGFSNADSIVVTPALVVNVSSGSFTNGEYVSQPDIGSNLQIVFVDDVTRAADGQVIIGLQPRGVDLANVEVNPDVWSVGNNLPIVNASNTVAGQVEEVLGYNAAGGVNTDAAGRVVSIEISDPGVLYSVAPNVRVRSPGNLAGIASLQLEARNWLARVRVHDASSAVGDGYAFSVSEGVVWLRGHFLRVAPQTIIVSEYDTAPDDVGVGFDAVESIVTRNQDTSLDDPLVGSSRNAPGADRLQIVPVLRRVRPSLLEEGDPFLTLVEWREGFPYKQSQQTEYSRIGDEMARRTFEAEGNFVTDRFEVTTVSPANSQAEGTKLSIAVDPGVGYISGHRVETMRNYVIEADKGVDSSTERQAISMPMGQYVRVRELAGGWRSNLGASVSLRSAASQYLTGGASGAPSAAGTAIGNARIRSVVHESGVPGTPSAVYRVYLFAINVSAGRNFRNTRSLVNVTNGIVADVVLEPDPATGQTGAVLRDSTSNPRGLIYPIATSVKSVSNVEYVVRTTDAQISIANTGVLTKSLAGNTTDFFRFPGVQSDDALLDFTVVPTTTVRASSALTGTVTVNTTSANMVGSGTSFASELSAGDWVYVVGDPEATQNTVRRVVQVVNNTLVVLSSNSPFSNVGGSARRALPAYVPIPFGGRSGMSGSVDANGEILTLDVGFELESSANVVLSYDYARRGATPGTKAARRKRFVKISIANNAGGTEGPWCLGHPDVIRLRNVYLGSNSGVSTSSMPTGDDFYVDSNHRPDYVDLSWLYLKPDSSLNLTSSDWLLVEFDHVVVTQAGYFTAESYVSSNAELRAEVDSLPLANLDTQISSFEVPMVYVGDQALDLLGCLDVRPYVSNTVASATTAGAAAVNPPSTFVMSLSTEKFFPLPDTSMLADVEQYLGRRDAVIVGYNGGIAVLRGEPSADPRKRTVRPTPLDAMLLNVIEVPPYPTLPVTMSAQLSEVVETGVANERKGRDLLARRTAQTTLTPSELNDNQPFRYTQRDVGAIDRRLQNVEYYVGLSLLETSLKDKVIPSDVDGTDRFKFGMFVDDYSTPLLQAIDDPQYSADVENGRLVPEKWRHVISHDPGSDRIFPPYVRWRAVRQKSATVVPTPQPDCFTPDRAGNNIFYMVGGEEDWRWFTAKTFWQTEQLFVETLSMAGAFSGNVTLYVDAGGTNGISYDTVSAGGNFVNVYRGNTLIRQTSDLVPITTAEKTRIKGPTFNDWFRPSLLQNRVLGSNTDFFAGAGKLTWTHDPSLGNDYTIVFAKGRTQVDTDWRLAVEYPVDLFETGCPTPVLPGLPTRPPTPAYEGFIRVRDVAAYPAVYERPPVFLPSPYADGRWFHQVTITAYGLKPNTRHTFFLDGNEMGQLGYDPAESFGINGPSGLTGSRLTSDSRGMLSFRMVLFKARRPTSTVQTVRTAFLFDLVGPRSRAFQRKVIYWPFSFRDTGQSSDPVK